MKVWRALTLLVLLLAVCELLAARANYTPPTGIPNPTSSWGFSPFTNEVPPWPAQWPSTAVPNWYYVDNTHGSATDTANTYGTPDLPRLSIPTTLSAGAVVLIYGSNYSANVNLTAAGTVDSPVIIAGNTNSRTELRGNWTVVSGSYLFIENLSWTQDKIFTISPTTAAVQIANVLVRNCEVAGTGIAGANGAAFVVGEATHLPPTNIIFFECVARDYGQWDTAVENDRHGFSVGTGTQYVWWLRCLAYHNGGDGWGNGHDANHTSHHLYLGDSAMWENRENAIDLKEVHDVVISSNSFWNYRTVDSSSGTAVVVHYGPTTGEGGTNILIINNRIWDSDYGIASTESHQDAYWVGNLVFNCGTALYPDRGGGAFHLYNNTLVNCAYGVYSSGTVDGLFLRNNLIVNATNEAVRVTSVTVRSASTWSNDMYYSAIGAVNINWGGTVYSSVASWSAATGKGASVLELNPALNPNYTLSAGSPAVGAGVNVSSVFEAAYLEIFGFSFSYHDMAGSALGATPDLGAFQYTVGTPSLPFREAFGGRVSIGGKSSSQ